MSELFVIKILNQINSWRGGFITPTEFSERFRISIEKSAEVLDTGVCDGIFFQTSSSDNPQTSEYGIKGIIMDEIKNKIIRDDLKKFDEFLNKYFGEIQENLKILDEELTILRDDCLQALALKQRTRATELLVQKIEENNFIYTTKDDIKSEAWIYREGLYKPQGESYIKEFCRLILGHAYTTQLVNEVINKIKADTFIEQDNFFRNENPIEVPILDGILNVITKEVYPFSPKKIFFNKLPINYDRNAKCPKITEHFKTILKDESDAEVMFELFGYLLLKENRLEKSFMFLGNGRNGKSKTLELIKRFLGVDNCSALPLKSMHEESFSLSELFGKMCNIAGDLSSDDLKSTGTFKMLTGRDTIQAKRKFLRDLFFVNYSKLIFACNELPKVFDMSEGFWSRWLLLEFPYKFITQKEIDELPESEKTNKKLINPDIIEEITTPEELSGLLNKALEGLERILNNKEFSYSKGTQEVKDTWIRVSNSFTAFCIDCLEEDYNSKISKKELRKKYHQYCRFYRLRGAGDKEIKATLQDMFGVIESREFQGDNQWDGITFKGNNGFSTYRGKKSLPIGEKTPVTSEYDKIEVVKISNSQLNKLEEKENA